MLRAAMSARRAAATALIALLAAAGLAAATPAVMAAEDPEMSVVWFPPRLFADNDADGRASVGDEVRTGYRFRLTGASTATVNSFTFGSTVFTVNRHFEAGWDLGSSLPLTVDASHMDSLGGGPHFPIGTITFTVDGVQYTNDLPPIPTLQATPTPITVSTTFHLTKNDATDPNRLRENDFTYPVTTVVNTSAVDIEVTDTSGYYRASDTSQVIAAGSRAYFRGDAVRVTYDHMAAGGVDFADTTLTWSATDVSGTVDVPIGAAPTEPIAATAHTTVDLEVNTAAGAPVALGDAVAGDVVDYTFDVTNTGNVRFDAVSLTAPSSGVSTASALLYPGASLATAHFPVRYLSSRPGALSPVVLTAADIDRGYVDLDFAVKMAPNNAAYLANTHVAKQSLTERVFLRTFTTAGTLTVEASLNDSNGDGLGQEGETVTYSWTLDNGSDQAVTLTELTDAAGADAAVTTTSYDGTTVARDGSATGSFEYVLTAVDEARGSVAYSMDAALTGDADGGSTTASGTAASIPTGPYVAPPVTFTASADFVDGNGDGKANPGETLTVTVDLSNDGTYPLTGITVADATGTDLAGRLPADIPATLAAGADAQATFTYVLADADVTAGTLAYAATLTADGMAPATTTPAASVSVEAYVAPAHTIVVTESYADDNADGFPSIGEKVTFEVTVTNAGGYPLTDLVITDAVGFDVTGLPPAAPVDVAPGDDVVVSFDYVVTAADFARGTLGYSAKMTALGLALPTHALPVELTGLTFVPYASDLDGVAEGGVTICTASGGAVTELTIGEDYWVTPGACGTGGDPTGYRVVAFSTPMVLATDTFGVTVPGELGQGAHRIALYAPSGELYGWRGVNVSDPIAFSGPGGSLANTGADDALALATAWAIALAVLGSAMAATAGLRPRRVTVRR